MIDSDSEQNSTLGRLTRQKILDRNQEFNRWGSGRLAGKESRNVGCGLTNRIATKLN
jgi:hypothetical protein